MNALVEHSRILTFVRMKAFWRVNTQNINQSVD